AQNWYFVAASYDVDDGVVALWQSLVARIHGRRELAYRRHQLAPLRPTAPDAPIMIAAWKERRPGDAFGLFNGKIERPTIFRTALSGEQVERLRFVAQGELAHDADLGVMWDFAVDQGSWTLADVSRNGLHAQLVNAPLRAVTSHGWDGHEIDFKQASDQYAAAHFHDDDLEDARWAPTVSFELPRDVA